MQPAKQLIAVRWSTRVPIIYTCRSTPAAAALVCSSGWWKQVMLLRRALSTWSPLATAFNARPSVRFDLSFGRKETVSINDPWCPFLGEVFARGERLGALCVCFFFGLSGDGFYGSLVVFRLRRREGCLLDAVLMVCWDRLRLGNDWASFLGLGWCVYFLVSSACVCVILYEKVYPNVGAISICSWSCVNSFLVQRASFLIFSLISSKDSLQV